LKQKEAIRRSIQYWDRLAKIYDDILLNNFTAEESSILYEEFEDDFLKRLIEGKIQQGEKLVLIEIGSGTGRYIQHYCSYPEISLIIGIDVSYRMLEKSVDKLKRSSFANEIGRRILLVQGEAEDISLSIRRHEQLKHNTPVVICMFNTLGNIELEDRRQNVLLNVREMIEPNGIAVISVFNRELLRSEGKRYYTDERIVSAIVPPTFGNRIRSRLKQIFPYLNPVHFDFSKGDVKTTDFYSHWFTEQEIKDLIKNAGLRPIHNSTIVGIKSAVPKAKRGILSTVVASSLK